MEDGASVVSVGNVLTEVLAGDGGFFLEQFDANVAVIGFDRDHDVSNS